MFEMCIRDRLTPCNDLEVFIFYDLLSSFYENVLFISVAKRVDQFNLLHIFTDMGSLKRIITGVTCLVLVQNI